MTLVVASLPILTLLVKLLGCLIMKIIVGEDDKVLQYMYVDAAYANTGVICASAGIVYVNIGVVLVNVGVVFVNVGEVFLSICC